MSNESLLGTQLPTLTLKSSVNGSLTLPKDLLGKWTVLYFYPKDDTPGCTKQACSYRDRLPDFTKMGIQVLGVSLDDLGSHDSFIKKFSLNFPLLSDSDHLLSEALGTYGDQEWKGQKFKGLSRDTFLIDPQGKIREIWRKVNAELTMAETLAKAQSYM